MDISSRVDVVYNVFNKEDFTLKKLEKGIPDLKKLSQRDGPKDMYKKDIAPDYLDNLKVAKVQERLVQKKKNTLVELGRQKKRDFTAILKTTDAYANIQRDNQRAEYIKQILQCDD